MEKITEQSGPHRHLERRSTADLLNKINQEDQTVAHTVQQVLPAIVPLVDLIADKLKVGGRLFYLGAGTSGRLGVLDASEIPPTYGVSPDLVIGIIAGGDQALRKAVEHAEDDPQQAMRDLQIYQPDERDIVLGLAASGTTPYVVGGLKDCRIRRITTACITCNPGTPLATEADYPIEVIVGPEIVRGSTRMKAGTAQKLILNLISTSVMIKLGRVVDNQMVDMMLTNDKLLERGSKMIADQLNIDYDQANALLQQYGSVRKAIDAWIKEA